DFPNASRSDAAKRGGLSPKISVMPERKLKVLVAMSGGVDSSVAAALLLRQGCEVVGCFMRLGSPGESFDELLDDDAQFQPQAGPEPSASPGANGHAVCAPRSDKPLKIGHQGCCSINDAADARLVAASLGIHFYVCR